jgi:methylated-DNA-[protein]-cysteine S-methyltransferase
MDTRHTVIDSPIGPLTLVAEGEALAAVSFETHPRRNGRRPPGPAVQTPDLVLERAVRQLNEYFAGERTAFDLPTVTHGEEFEERVWAQLREIPYGRTTTYGQIAAAFGDKTLAQTVGRAVGNNPLAVVLPCHRVIGADGSLTGYAGGLDRKRYLLELEEPADLAAQRLL